MVTERFKEDKATIRKAAQKSAPNGVRPAGKRAVQKKVDANYTPPPPPPPEGTPENEEYYLNLPAEPIDISEFDYDEVKAKADLMRQQVIELKRKGIKETKNERLLRVYGTVETWKLSAQEMLRRNHLETLSLLDDEREREAGRITTRPLEEVQAEARKIIAEQRAKQRVKKS